MADWIPVISQVKSAVQAIAGDPEGARRTQENFSRQCIGVSQVRSAVEAILGDEEGARQTQMEFLRNTGELVDSVPVVGHIKSAVHAIAGDQEGAMRSAISATRGMGVALAGVAGTIMGGPVAGAGAAVGAGAAIDTAFTLGTNYRHPQGVYEAVANAENNVPGAVFDAVFVPVGDALMPGPENVVTGKIKPLKN